MLPLYEAKMIHHYDHRWATYEPDGSIRDVTLAEKQDPELVVLPRYWVRSEVVQDRLDGKWDQEWLLGWRRIARSTDERSMIISSVTQAAFGDSVFLMLPSAEQKVASCLQANLSSFVFDFVFRQKLGGTNTSFFLVEQLAVLAPGIFLRHAPWNQSWPLDGWIDARVETLTADWSSDRAAALAELDAAMFHLYGIERDDVDYIMETFPIVRRKDEAMYGSFRTKLLILDVYDQMAEAIRTGVPYESPLDVQLSEAGKDE